jgi:hypothetical protein
VVVGDWTRDHNGVVPLICFDLWGVLGCSKGGARWDAPCCDAGTLSVQVGGLYKFLIDHGCLGNVDIGHGLPRGAVGMESVIV